MGLDGDELNDLGWATLAPHLPGKAGDVGGTAAAHRLFLKAVRWTCATAAPAHRLLLARFGKHATVRKRALGWAQQGNWQPLSQAVRLPAMEAILLDATMLRAQQWASKRNVLAMRPSAAAG